jgi:hypothetical protein
MNPSKRAVMAAAWSMLLPSPVTHRPLAFPIGGPAERIAANLDFIVGKMRKEIRALTASGGGLLQLLPTS